MNSRSQNFFDNDDELEIDFTKFNSKNFSDGENEKSMDDFDGTGINKTVSDNVEDNGYTGVSFDNSEPFVQSAVSLKKIFLQFRIMTESMIYHLSETTSVNRMFMTFRILKPPLSILKIFPWKVRKRKLQSIAKSKTDMLFRKPL